MSRCLFVGTQRQHGPAGLFRLDLAAGTTELCGLENTGSVREIVVDGDDPSVIYAATAAAGVMRSDDGGATWTSSSAGLASLEVWSLAQQRADGTLWAGTGPVGVYRSEDRGRSWQRCTGTDALDQSEWAFPGPGGTPHIKSLAVTELDPSLILGAVEEGWVIRSEDRGTTWTSVREGCEYDAHYVHFIPGSADDVMLASGKGCYRSENGGRSFLRSDAGMSRIYMTPIACHPDRPERMLTAAAEVPPPGWRRPEGASAGFFRSLDHGRTWTKCARGLPDWFESAPRTVACDPNDPDMFVVGMLDGTIWMTDDGGDAFRQVAADLPSVSSLAVVS